MNLADIKQALTANLGGESATDLHSLADRLRAINQAYSDITLDLEITQNVTELNLPINGSAVTPPSPYTLISDHGVILSDGSRLIQVAMEDIRLMRGDVTTTGRPTHFAVDSHNGQTAIEVFPTADLGYKITASFVNENAKLELDAHVPWGGRYAMFHTLIPLRAAHILYREKGLDQAAMQASRFWLSEYDREVARLERLRKREAGGATTLRMRTPTSRSRRRYFDE